MEKALLIQPLDILKIHADLLQKFDAIYLGNDFCQHLMPSAKDVNYIRKRWDKKIVLTTPILTGNDVEKTLRFINKMAAGAQITEVIVNDWGMLYALRDAAVHVSLGRLLFFQLKKYHKEFLTDFFKKYRVRTVETDDPKFIRNIPENIKISFHYPLRLLSFSRFCPHIKNITLSCRRICQNKIVPLYSPSAKKFFYLNDNAYFELDQRIFNCARVSRTVFLYKARLLPQ